MMTYFIAENAFASTSWDLPPPAGIFIYLDLPPSTGFWPF
jgi:hypothetical protein